MLVPLVLVFLYPYGIYPVVLFVALRFARRRQDRQHYQEPTTPKVALVICALNEERSLRRS